MRGYTLEGCLEQEGWGQNLESCVLLGETEVAGVWSWSSPEPLGIDGCQVRTENPKGVDLRSRLCSRPYMGAFVALAG